MAGVAFTQLQSSGVITTWCTILDIRWQPGLAADIKVGYFLDEPTFLSGATAVHMEYVALDITQIVPTGNIPMQIFNQLTAPGALLAGGQLTS